MDLQWQEWGLCSYSPLLSGPLRQPSDSGLPVATPLFKLPPWVPGKYTFSHTTTSAGAVKAPSVLWLTAFQLQASKALYVLYTTSKDAGCFPLFGFAFITQAFLIGQKHSQEQQIDKHTGPTCIRQVWCSECFVLLNTPSVEQHSPSSPDMYNSMHTPLTLSSPTSFPFHALLHSKYSANVLYFLLQSFFFSS